MFEYLYEYFVFLNILFSCNDGSIMLFRSFFNVVKALLGVERDVVSRVYPALVR